MAILEKPPVWASIVVLVLLLQAWLILRHEPFVDEWQAVQVAVQSPGWPQLLENLSYEGHPPLWYMLLRGLAEVFGPYNALAAATLLLGFVTQWLILLESPFPRWARLLIALSEFVLFEYNTVSRSYTLGVMLTFATVAWWDRRRQVWFLIAALPFTDFLFGVISLGFVFLRWREKAIWRPGAGVWVAISLFAAWTVIPASDFVPVYAPATRDMNSVILWLVRLSSVFLPLQGDDFVRWDQPLPAALSLTMWTGFLAVAWLQTGGRRDMRLVIGGFLAVTLAFSFALNPLAIRHIMLAGVLLIALTWRMLAQGDAMRQLFAIWLGILAGTGLFTAAINLVHPFDTAPVAARKIRALGLADEHWSAYPQQHGQGIAAMTGMRFQRMADTCMQDMVRWNQAYPYKTIEEMERGAVAEAEAHGRYYILTDTPMASSEQIRELAFVPGGLDGKDYRLFEIGPDLRPYSRKLPHCAPGTPRFTDTPKL